MDISSVTVVLVNKKTGAFTISVSALFVCKLEFIGEM